MTTPETPYDAVEQVCSAIGLPQHFVLNLLGEDDWSYVVKAHALAEAAVTHAIEKKLAGHNVRHFLEHMGMKRRLDFALSLGALPEELVKATRRLSKLRNDLVHDIRRTSFTFDDYLRDESFRNSFFKDLLANVSGTITIDNETLDHRGFCRENPKWAVNEVLFDLLLEVYCRDAESALRDSQMSLGQMVQSFMQFLRRRATRPDTRTNQ